LIIFWVYKIEDEDTSKTSRRKKKTFSKPKVSKAKGKAISKTKSKSKSNRNVSRRTLFEQRQKEEEQTEKPFYEETGQEWQGTNIGTYVSYLLPYRRYANLTVILCMYIYVCIYGWMDGWM
jgi:hypothetical protein